MIEKMRKTQINALLNSQLSCGNFVCISLRVNVILQCLISLAKSCCFFVSLLRTVTHVEWHLHEKLLLTAISS